LFLDREVDFRGDGESVIKCIAFDCFGTVFDMSGVSREEIKAYVAHVRKDDFTPFEFPKSWWQLKAHHDSKEGINMLQSSGFLCVALSNGDCNLIDEISERNGFDFDYLIDLAGRHRVYKPNVDAYRTIEKDLGYKPEETLMVTANPTFGDVEGSAAIGMSSQVIRQPGTPQTIIELATMLKGNQ
jgi:HAD superfamily hydrolase (TIGR01493 family)